MSDRRAGRLAQALLAVFFSLAPASVPSWRLLPRPRPVAVEFVGEPTPALVPRHRG